MNMVDLKEARCATYIHIKHVYNSLKEICFNALNLPCVPFLYMCMDFNKKLLYKLINENLPITLAQFAHMQRKQDQFAKTNKALQFPQSFQVKKTLHTCTYTQNHHVGLKSSCGEMKCYSSTSSKGSPTSTLTSISKNISTPCNLTHANFKSSISRCHEVIIIIIGLLLNRV